MSTNWQATRPGSRGSGLDCRDEKGDALVGSMEGVFASDLPNIREGGALVRKKLR